MACHARLLEQKRPFIHKALQIYSLVYLFSLGKVCTLHKSNHLRESSPKQQYGSILGVTGAWTLSPSQNIASSPQKISPMEFERCQPNLKGVIGRLGDGEAENEECEEEDGDANGDCLCISLLCAAKQKY